MRSDLGKDNPLPSGGVLVVEASADALASFHDDPGIMLAPVARHGGKANDQDAPLVQAIIGPGSEFICIRIRVPEDARPRDGLLPRLWRPPCEHPTRPPYPP